MLFSHCFAPSRPTDSVHGRLRARLIRERIQQPHTVCAGRRRRCDIFLLHVRIHHTKRRIGKRPVTDSLRRFRCIAPALVCRCNVIADLRQNRAVDVLHGQSAVTDHLASPLQTDCPQPEAEHAVALHVFTNSVLHPRFIKCIRIASVDKDTHARRTHRPAFRGVIVLDRRQPACVLCLAKNAPERPAGLRVFPEHGRQMTRQTRQMG